MYRTRFSRPACSFLMLLMALPLASETPGQAACQSGS